jgi:glycerol-1-phosphate dehydrogenase [NAD(P)+]
MDSEICALVEEALDTVMKMSPSDEGYTEKVLRCLVLSGLSIQYYGSSRPASGSEHHLSHLWEMHCMNSPTDALHGEQVGVSTLLVLEKYKSLLESGIRFIPKRDNICAEYLSPVYGGITEGIIEENTPYPLDGVDGELSPEAELKIRELIEGLPSVEFIRDYLKSVGAKTTLSELGLPDSDDFAQKSLEFAPYARRRLTLLKLI